MLTSLSLAGLGDNPHWSQLGVGVGVRVVVGVRMLGGVLDGIAVGGVPVTVGVGDRHTPPVVRFTSVVNVVMLPVSPPHATTTLPTAAPPGKERSSMSDGPPLQLFATGSYTRSAF